MKNTKKKRSRRIEKGGNHRKRHVTVQPSVDLMDVVAGRKAFPSTSSSVQQLTAVVHRKYISTSSVLFDFPLLSHVLLLLLTELSSRNEEKKTQIYFSQFLFGLRLFRLYDCALVSILLRFSQLSPLFMCPSVKY